MIKTADLMRFMMPIIGSLRAFDRPLERAARTPAAFTGRRQATASRGERDIAMHMHFTMAASWWHIGGQHFALACRCRDDV